MCEMSVKFVMHMTRTS